MKAASKKQIGFIIGLAKKNHGIEYHMSDFLDENGDIKYTSLEASKMIQSLKSDRQKKEQETPENKMKKKIISMAHTIGWEHKNGKIDMTAVNTWCTQKGMYKKALDAHNYTELIYLVTQFQNGPFKHALTKS